MTDIEKLREENKLLRQLIESIIQQLQRERDAPFMYGHRVDSLVRKIQDSLDVLPRAEKPLE